MTASVTALGYLEIGASDLEGWRSYATDVLGVEAYDDADGVNLRYDDRIWRVRIVPSPDDDVTCAGFSVDSEHAIASIVTRLEKSGVKMTEANAAHRKARGVDVLWRCEDPAGLAVELYVGDRRGAGAFELSPGVTGFVTGDLGLGHIVLSMPDPEAARRFYMEGLGFRLSDHILVGPPDRRLELTFLHCNPRHHTLAMVPIRLPKRLNHIMLQVTTLDDVGRCLDRARTAGVAISSSLGKHTNDRMISFYMKTPSGFDIEYGFGGIEVDDATWEPTTYDATSIWGHAN